MTISLRPAAPPSADLPPLGPRIRRLHRHPRLKHYNRLIAAVLGANAALAWYGVSAGWWSGDGIDLARLALIAQVDLLVAVLPRQQYAINVAGWLATRPGHRWPLRVRWLLAKHYQLGGVHVGSALAAACWYLAFVVASVVELRRGSAAVSGLTVGLALAVSTVFVVMVVLALPAVRSRHHDWFEASHRLGAWTALALVWVSTVASTAVRNPDRPLFAALLETPSAWLLVPTTVFATWPWLLLRRVPITVERPSGHAAVVHVHHDVPYVVGTTRPISRHPIIGWHQFAVIPPPPGRTGFRMVVSRAGDWTGAFVDDPPSHVWIRGIPAVGVANARRLFRKVVFVVTGSGIGPGLGHILADELPTKLVWVTREPRRTYGDGLVDEVLAAQPDALIWDTDALGKPDVLALAHRIYVESGAEAVVCISNRTLTWRVVHGLEQRGIPAFGPIWDS
jgi:hypothetical protein